VPALKGSLLRQEVYTLDGTGKKEIPYAVTEQNFGLKMLQPRVPTVTPCSSPIRERASATSTNGTRPIRASPTP
jgi:hypothetical protein